MSKSQSKFPKKIIIPKGSIQPNETVVIEIPSRLKNNSTVLARRKSPKCPPSPVNSGAQDTFVSQGPSSSRPPTPMVPRPMSPQNYGITNQNYSNPYNASDMQMSYEDPNLTVAAGNNYGSHPIKRCMEPYESALPRMTNEVYKTRYHNPTDISFRPSSPNTTFQVNNQSFAPQFQNTQAHEYQSSGQTRYNTGYSPKTSSFKPETAQNLGGVSNTSIETYTEEVTEEYESSGDVDDSLLGRIMRGEIDKKMDWPTPTSEAGVQGSGNSPFSENVNYNRGRNTNCSKGENVTYTVMPDTTNTTMRNSSCNMENVTYSNKLNRPFSAGGNATYTINEEPNYDVESSLYTDNICSPSRVNTNYTIQDGNPNRRNGSASYPSRGNISYNTTPDVSYIHSNTTNQYYDRENPYTFKEESEAYSRGEPTSNKHSTPSTPTLHLQQPYTADYQATLPKKKFSRVSTTSEEITEEFYDSPEADIDDLHLRKIIKNDGGKKTVWSAPPSNIAIGKETNRSNVVYSVPKASLHQVQGTPHHSQVPFTTYTKPFHSDAYEIPREKSTPYTKNVKFNGNKATMFEVSSTPSGDTFQEEEITGLYNASDEGICNEINKVTLSVIPIENEKTNQFEKHKRNSPFTKYSAGENIQNSHDGSGGTEEGNYNKFLLQGNSPGKTIRKVTKKTTKTIINPKGNASKTYTKIQTSLINPTFSEGQEAGENVELKKMEAVEKSHLEQNLKKWQEARRRLILNSDVPDVNGANIKDTPIVNF
ncbi:hypothetical protein ILUMI_26156 [Ignelater luminosus]|uniref:Uncharacterized protein n=1 Tax=Ignelater luminosus TaxID=2038154 RepID=A0A8K0FW07_IGNLU|nr:hypothetical protein ILUMI_26156 [Ignelater luminosus]